MTSPPLLAGRAVVYICFYFFLSFTGKYVNDFVVSKGQNLKTGQALQINNVSLDACSKLCVENSGIACKAFSYGTASAICKLLGVDPVKNRANITKSTSDLYTSEYLTKYIEAI